MHIIPGVFRNLQKRNVSWLKQKPSEGFGFVESETKTSGGLDGWREGQLSTQDRSFVAGSTSDRSIWFADIRENRTIGRNLLMKQAFAWSKNRDCS